MSRGTIDFGGCAPGPCLDAAARCARPGVALVFFAATCAQAATLATIDTGPVAGQPSLEIGADGLPVIAYRTLTNKLRVAKCGNWDCTDVMRIELTGTYTTTAHFSLAITPSGFPGIAFQDSVERRLDVVRCVTTDCTGGGHSFFTIDPGPNDVSAYVDWAFGPDNRAAFAYRDGRNPAARALHHARVSERGHRNAAWGQRRAHRRVRRDRVRKPRGSGGLRALEQ